MSSTLCLLRSLTTALYYSPTKTDPGDQTLSNSKTFGTTLHHEPFHKLYHKLQATAKALRVWSKQLIPNAKLQLHMALEVILRLDEAQEYRQLSPEEQTLRKSLKLRVQGLAVIERARRSQAA